MRGHQLAAHQFALSLAVLLDTEQHRLPTRKLM
jgi:hypothetical protein